jgi:hypothetical protein
MTLRICRVVSFEHTAPYTLTVRFDDATQQVIDFRPVLASEIYAPLRDLTLFDQVRIDPEVHTRRGRMEPISILKPCTIGRSMPTPSRRAPAPGRRALRRKARTQTVAGIFTDLLGSGNEASRRVATVAATPLSVHSAGTLRDYTNVRMIASNEGGALRWYRSPGLGGIPGSSTETSGI